MKETRESSNKRRRLTLFRAGIVIYFFLLSVSFLVRISSPSIFLVFSTVFSPKKGESELRQRLGRHIQAIAQLSPTDRLGLRVRLTHLETDIQALLRRSPQEGSFSPPFREEVENLSRHVRQWKENISTVPLYDIQGTLWKYYVFFNPENHAPQPIMHWHLPVARFSFGLAEGVALPLFFLTRLSKEFSLSSPTALSSLGSTIRMALRPPTLERQGFWYSVPAFLSGLWLLVLATVFEHHRSRQTVTFLALVNLLFSYSLLFTDVVMRVEGLFK